jgi:hypothetical protein
MNDGEKEHGRQLFNAYLTSTENLATGMLALGERIEVSNRILVQSIEESRRSREQQAALQRQIGVLVQVLSRQQGIPVAPLPQIPFEPENPIATMGVNAIQGLLDRYRNGGG